MWIPEPQDIGRPVHRGLAKVIERAIANGILSAGERLAPQREFAFRLGVTVTTVNKAFNLLLLSGLIVSRVGRGSYVGAFPEDLRETSAVEFADFGDNSSLVAPLNDFMNRVFGSIARRKSLAALLEYHDVGTITSHRRAAVHWLSKRGLIVSDDWIILAEDGRNALISLLMQVTQQKRKLATSSYGPQGLRSALAFHGVTPVSTPLLPANIDRRALNDLGDAAALWCAPTGDDPTNSLMPLGQRQILAEWATSSDSILIEDDTSGHLSGDRSPPLAMLAPEHTVYIAGMLKGLTPGLPICIIVMPPRLQDLFRPAIEASNWRSPRLAGEIFATLVTDGIADRLLASHRKTACERMAIAASIPKLARFVPTIASNHLWITLPDSCDDKQLATTLAAEGIIVIPSSAFALADGQPPALRVSLTATRSPDELRLNLKRLAQMLPTMPA